MILGASNPLSLLTRTQTESSFTHPLSSVTYILNKVDTSEMVVGKGQSKQLMFVPGSQKTEANSSHLWDDEGFRVTDSPNNTG